MVIDELLNKRNILRAKICNIRSDSLLFKDKDYLKIDLKKLEEEYNDLDKQIKEYFNMQN